MDALRAGFVIIVLLYNVLLANGGAIVHNADNPNRIPNEYLIKINTAKWQEDIAEGIQKEEKIDQMTKKLNETGLEVVARYTFKNTIILNVRSEKESLAMSAYKMPEVEFVEANILVSVFENIDNCTTQTLESSRWALPRIAQREKFDSSKTEYKYMENDGMDTYAYVVDTGIYLDNTHFEGRASHGFHASWLILEGPNDLNGHGTHCAGSIMSNTFGVAKKAKAIAVKVLGRGGTGSVSGIVEGLEWVFDDFESKNNSFKAVASMSLGGQNLLAVDAAVEELIAAGLPVVVAAGNDNKDACNYSPAGVKDAITVGASDEDDDLAYYSNWGKCVDIIAPGSNIESTGHRYPYSTTTLSGTSMATPHVAGAILRFMSQSNSSSSPEDIKNWLVSIASSNRIDLRGTSETPNKLLYAPCNVIDVIDEPSNSNIMTGTFSLVLFNAILAVIATLAY